MIVLIGLFPTAILIAALVAMVVVTVITAPAARGRAEAGGRCSASARLVAIGVALLAWVANSLGGLIAVMAGGSA